VQALIFFSSLAGLIVLIWLLSLVSNYVSEQFIRAAQRQQSDSLFHRVARYAGIYGEPDRPTSYENEQDQKRKLDADMVLWTRAVARYTKALVIVGAIGATIALGTLWVIKGQLDAQEADQRPWIKVEVDLGGGSLLRSDSSHALTLPLDIQVKNVGKSPAFKIRAAVRGFLFTPGSSVLAEQKRVCDGFKSSRPEIGISDTDLVIFPDEKRPTGQIMGMSTTAIFFTPQLIDKTLIETREKTLDIWAVGCAEYAFGKASEYHQTAFIYHLGHATDADDGSKHLTFRFSPVANIPARELKLFPIAALNGQTN
jgi:hypothetical protein